MSRELKNLKKSLKGSQAVLTSRLRRTTENQLDKAERARRESEDERLSRLLSSFQQRKSLTDIDATSATSPKEEPEGRQLPANPLRQLLPKREDNQDSSAQHHSGRGTQPVDSFVSGGNSIPVKGDRDDNGDGSSNGGVFSHLRSKVKRGNQTGEELQQNKKGESDESDASSPHLC